MEFSAKKSLGQHFLNNRHVPMAMAGAASVTKHDVVVEIGPGTGVLTETLLMHGGEVIAIETDKRAITVLEEKFHLEIKAKKLVILDSDVRKLELSKLGLRAGGYKVVANIPYYLSGMLFRAFLESDTFPSELVFLVQKEVAERIARDKKESLLSLGVKAFGIPEYVKTVKKGNFTPQPKVDSAIIAVHGISHDRFLNLDRESFFEILHLGFGSKRKQLLGNLSKKYSRASLEAIFRDLKLSTTIRAEDLSLDGWFALSSTLLQQGT